ncbi:DUF4394 domain-containing protein [Massilia sp. TSP1-1-2]|uniref:DUF4394 domain-containing protein n=1 Tax=Massilia sp. TSP1-1-2 TaxID=2804649 RepID=UPI003CE98F99
MHTPPLPKLLLAAAITLTLSACGGSDDYQAPATPVPPAPPVLDVGDAVVLSASGKLASFNLDAPATLRTNVAITGLQAGEVLLGIDFRPADGNLYGVGSTGRIYTLNPATGAATVKSTMAADAADTSAPFASLEGTEFGVDFNPAADRLRVIGSLGQSLRINVDTGATTTDGAINGGAAGTAINAAAYTNAFAGTANTTLFVIDARNGTLYTQNPPNNGTLTTPVSLGVSASIIGGFDIDARNNQGYAVMTVGGARNLYAVNLAASAAAATLVSALGVTEDIKGFALRTLKSPVVYGLTDGARLIGFKPLTPSTLDTDVAITGLASGEKLLGIDIRPKDGLMYAISSTGRIHTIDPVTGVASFKVALAADAADLTLPYAMLAGSDFAVDFNPVADRLRVISNAGQSLRINVDTGAATTDGSINRSGATPVVTAGAYTNSFAGTGATMLMVLDSDSDSLALQNPPNDGTLTNIGALGLDLAGDGGMDIAGGANGLVLASLRTAGAGPSRLYRVDLASGAALPVNGAANAALSVIGAGTMNVLDIAVSLK